MMHKTRTVFERLSTHKRFIKNWADAPMTTGAIAPSSSKLAQKMASYVPLDSSLPVLEIGPGTGSVTRAILDHGVSPKNLMALEYNTEFCELIKGQFPNIRVIQGDAYALSKTLQDTLGDAPKFAAIVSSLPLLTRPIEDRAGLLQQSLTHLASGAPYIQFSYGFSAPIEKPENMSLAKSHWILRNIPPARVYVYRGIF